MNDNDKVVVAFATVFLMVFTGTLFWSTLGLWRATKDGIDLAEKAHASEQRPWLSLKLKSVTQLLKRVNYAEITYRPLVANVGRTPAFDVHAYHMLIRDFDGSPKANFELFMADSRTSYIEPSRERSGVVFPDGRPDESSEQTVGEYKGTPQTMVGRFHLLFLCVFYRFEPEGELHRTASVYRLDLVGGDFTSPNIVFSSRAEDRPFQSIGFNSAT
ncbi:MAG: hypothetical protein HY834_19110 [Devosia nanyangense]|uniref:Uncharacterized protein n=1 Tax=Devosia nanyangense TaxID=1228055 RepID=A0A933L696_9HYPH|nr:hypothetical protein [Devosia nanyangense]